MSYETGLISYGSPKSRSKLENILYSEDSDSLPSNHPASHPTVPAIPKSRHPALPAIPPCQPSHLALPANQPSLPSSPAKQPCPPIQHSHVTGSLAYVERDHGSPHPPAKAARDQGSPHPPACIKIYAYTYQHVLAYIALVFASVCTK